MRTAPPTPAAARRPSPSRPAAQTPAPPATRGGSASATAARRRRARRACTAGELIASAISAALATPNASAAGLACDAERVSTRGPRRCAEKTANRSSPAGLCPPARGTTQAAGARQCAACAASGRRAAVDKEEADDGARRTAAASHASCLTRRSFPPADQFWLRTFAK